MDFLYAPFDFILHIDERLPKIAADYGSYAYLILFLIVFAETGLVVTPFLPGDSLLFAAGAVASREEFSSVLNVHVMVVLLLVAAIAGDAVNYSVGRYIGPKVFEMKGSRVFKPQYLQKTQRFFDKYGPKTIVIARFVPIVRTFAPFLAGVGTMSYRKFAAYNVIGAVLWVCGFTYAGYQFGQFPFVQKQFKLIILAIIVISFLPMVIEFIRARREARSGTAA